MGTRHLHQEMIYLVYEDDLGVNLIYTAVKEHKQKEMMREKVRTTTSPRLGWRLHAQSQRFRRDYYKLYIYIMSTIVGK